MSKINRRDFLKLGAIGLGSLTASELLAACSQILAPAVPSAPSVDRCGSNRLLPSPANGDKHGSRVRSNGHRSCLHTDSSEHPDTDEPSRPGSSPRRGA